MHVFFEIPEMLCPHCGKKLNAAESPSSDELPEADDLTVCVGCAHILKFGEALNLLPLQEGELEEIRRADPESYLEIQEIIASVLKAGVPADDIG